MTTAKERIEAAQKRKAAVEARLTPDRLKEIAEHEAAERAEADAAELEAKDRAQSLREAVARLAPTYGDHLRVVDLEARNAGQGAWIVKPADKAVIAQMQKDANQPKPDGDAINRRVAEECVVHWNGADGDDIDGEKMHALWDAFGMIPTTLAAVALELGGLVMDLRKSGG